MYRYTGDLLALERKGGQTSAADPRFTAVQTPLVAGAWKECLARHPDNEYVRFILDGIEHGFPLGVDGAASLVPA